MTGHILQRVRGDFHILAHRVFRKTHDLIGKPIARDAPDARSKDATAMMDFLRQSSYDLSPRPLAASDYGFDFEEQHR